MWLSPGRHVHTYRAGLHRSIVGRPAIAGNSPRPIVLPHLLNKV
jgi:hypothetical protein